MNSVDLDMQRGRAAGQAQETANAGGAEEAAALGTSAIVEALLYVGDVLRGETVIENPQLWEDLRVIANPADDLARQVQDALAPCPRDTDGDGNCGGAGCMHCRRREWLRARLNAIASTWQRVPVPPARATEAAGPPEVAREILSAVARTTEGWDGGMTSPIATTASGGRILVGYSGRRYTVMVEVDRA